MTFGRYVVPHNISFCTNWHQVSFIAFAMVSSMVSINTGNIENNCLQPDEAMLFVMIKACLHLKVVVLFRTLKDFVLIYLCYTKICYIIPT